MIGIASLVVAGVTFLLFRFNPAQYGFYPRCYFHALTGLDCPGCGSLRALHQLLHGNVEIAFGLNPLLVLAIPLGAVFALWRFLLAPKDRPYSDVVRPSWVWAGVGLLITFAILRNLSALV
jgi:hypothetical protein